jgi:hypothetical protein
MAILVDTRTGPVVQSDGAGDQPLRQSRMGALVVQDAHGRLWESASRRNLFMAHAIVTSPVAYTTTAGLGGPLLWNGSSTVNASILGVGWGLTTASAAAAVLGITAGIGQVQAPTSTTAIDTSGNMYLTGPAPACSVYRVGTVTNAGTRFLPLGAIHTGAVTVDTTPAQWVWLEGSMIIPPNCYAAVAASVVATTAVMQIGLIWEETPIGN